MGYDIKRFVNFDPRNNRDLICFVCNQVLQDPLRTECGHKFCNFCLDWWFGDSNQCFCPQCSIIVLRNSCTLITIHQINNLEIKCDYYDEGCGGVVKVDKLNSHLRSCPFGAAGRTLGQSSTATSSASRSVSINGSQRPADDRRNLLQSSIDSVDSDTTLRGVISANIGSICLLLWMIILLLLFVSSFIAMIVLGAYYINECPDNPSLPVLLIILGIIAISNILIITMKITWLRQIHRRILFTSVSLYFTITVIVIVFAYFIIDVQYSSFKNFWTPEVHFNCNVYVVWLLLWFSNITLIIIITVITLITCLCVATTIKKCYKSLFNRDT